MLSKLKLILGQLLRPLLRLLNELGVKPWHLTLSSVMLMTFYLLFSILYRNYLLMALLLGLSSFMDALDGALARFSGIVSHFGSFMDSVIDRFSDFLALLGLYLSSIINPLETMLAIFSFLCISYIRAKGESLGLRLEGVGVAERSERVILILAILILATFNFIASRALFYLLLILTYITVIQRIINCLKQLNEASKARSPIP